MTRNWMRLSLAPVLAVALWTAGCSEQGGELLGPGNKQAAVLRDASGRPITPVKEAKANDKTREGWAIFEPHLGGNIYVAGGHRLSIPRNAVDRQTLWKMEVFEDGLVRTQLTAYQRDAAGNFTVNVGPKGFRAPVEVTLSYKGAEGFDSAEALRVFWVMDETGTVVQQQTVVDAPGQKVRTYLHHFSEYVLAMP